MLRKVLFLHSSDIRYTAEIIDRSRKLRFVTPNTQKADSLRKVLKNDFLKNEFNEFDVISMREFIERGLSLSGMKKSELMLVLGVAWKKFFPEKSWPQFYKALNLLTDLRSYSLNLDLMTSILESFDEQSQRAVRLLWQLCSDLELKDEQRMYRDLAMQWESSPWGKEENFHFIFWGFEFFSNLQIELLESMAVKHGVDIWIPSIVFEKANTFDWPLWLKGESLSPFLPKAKNQKDDFNNGHPESPRVRSLVHYPKNHLNKAILSFFDRESSISNSDIVLFKDKVEIEDILELPVREHFFKSQNEFLRVPILKAHLQIQKFIGEKTEIAIRHCEDCLKKSIDDQNFREVKSWSFLGKILKEWKDRSKENEFLHTFDWELIRQILLLDQPRSFHIPLSEKGFKGDILNLKDFTSDSMRPILLIGQGKYYNLKSNHSPYSLEAINQLASIGPIKSKELDFLFIKQKFYEIFIRNQSFLFLEKGLEKENPEWKELIEQGGYSFKKFSLDHNRKKHLNNFKEEKIVKHKALRSISPTKLQTYLDCPRKYYARYIDGFYFNPLFKNEFSPREKGRLEHKVIGNYFEQCSNWYAFDENLFSDICGYIINQFCETEEKNLNTADYLLLKEEVRLYGRNGVLLLIDFLKEINNFEIKFEIPLENSISIDGKEYKLSGDVDCIIKSDRQDYLFDFKRSSSSIPTKKSIMEYEKIQLWHYAFHLSSSYDWKILGYINLSDPGKSLFISEGSSCRIKKKDIVQDLKSMILEYGKMEENYIRKILKEDHFLPNPTSSQTCRFCVLNSICERGL
ncbi:MAG: PD-(D/E)XK nuclease family protein [Bacteriovoracales bacterium]|nr:PD-(D/E)XK nuclease family protein [Bacteriovoracales bacterium]